MFSSKDSMQGSTCINSSAPCPIELPVSLPLSINCGAELWPRALSRCFFQGSAKNTKYTQRSTNVHSLVVKYKIHVQSGVQHYLRPCWRLISCHGVVRKCKVHGCLHRTCTSTSNGKKFIAKIPHALRDATSALLQLQLNTLGTHIHSYGYLQSLLVIFGKRCQISLLMAKWSSDLVKTEWLIKTAGSVACPMRDRPADTALTFHVFRTPHKEFECHFWCPLFGTKGYPQFKMTWRPEHDSVKESHYQFTHCC